MDFIGTAWRPSGFESGRVIDLPANYGLYGGIIPLNDTATFQTPLPYLTHRAMWNNLVSIQWDQIVLSAEEVSALGQAGLVQVPTQQPAQYTSPGTAAL